MVTRDRPLQDVAGERMAGRATRQRAEMVEAVDEGEGAAVQIPIGIGHSGDRRLGAGPIATRDLSLGLLLLGQLRGPILPVAGARFAHQVAAALEEMERAATVLPHSPGRGAEGHEAVLRLPS